jgi:hypothetical protein
VKGNGECDSSMLLPEDLISLLKGRHQVFWPNDCGGYFDDVFGESDH